MKMQHVTIMTRCLEDSVKFYQEQVGLTIVRDMRDNPAHQIVFLANAAGEPCVELIANPEAANSSEGISMGFAVDDVEVERKKKEEAGLQPGPMVSPNPKTKFFFVKDPNGVSIQFIQEL